MENKKPKQGHSTGFHGNQYVDSQGRPRNTNASGPKGAAKKTGGKTK